MVLVMIVFCPGERHMIQLNRILRSKSGACAEPTAIEVIHGPIKLVTVECVMLSVTRAQPRTVEHVMPRSARAQPRTILLSVRLFPGFVKLIRTIRAIR